MAVAMVAAASRLTCRFQDRGSERGFLVSRHAQLRSSAVFFSCIAILVLSIAIAFMWATRENATVCFVRSVMLTILVLMYLAAAVSLKCQRLLPMLGPVQVELLSAALTDLSLLVMTISTPSYLVLILGLDVPTDCLDELSHMIWLHCFVSATHIALPIRWVVLWHSELVAFLCFVVPAIARGRMSWPQILGNVLILTGLLLASSLGKRTVEGHERRALTQMLAEKTKRVEMDHS